jgi:hypothetical protein
MRLPTDRELGALFLVLSVVVREHSSWNKKEQVINS